MPPYVLSHGRTCGRVLIGSSLKVTGALVAWGDAEASHLITPVVAIDCVNRWLEAKLTANHACTVPVTFNTYSSKSSLFFYGKGGGPSNLPDLNSPAAEEDPGDRHDQKIKGNPSRQRSISMKAKIQ